MQNLPDPPAAQNFNSIAATVILIFALIFSGYAAFDHRAMMASGEAGAAQIAEQTALTAEGTLDATRQLLLAMTVMTRMDDGQKGPDAATLRAALLRLKSQNTQIMDLLILSGDGQIRHWTGSGRRPDVRDRPYYTAHIEHSSSKVHIGKPLLSKVHAGQWFFAMSEALRDDQGTLTHVVVAIIDVDLLRQRIGVRATVSDSTQALLAEDGTIYTRTPDHAQYVGKKVSRSDEIDRLGPANPFSTFISISQLDQKKRILSIRRLPNYPMTVAGTIGVDVLLAGWRQRVGILFVFWLVLAFSIAWLARRANAISGLQAELASIDSLTGISNRRTILNAASRLERSGEHADSLSLLMIDIDHFKTINDRFGHQVGDTMLQQVSEILRTQIRTTDIVGRYGGEEFLVLMPATGPQGALLVAEKLCRTVAERMTQPDQITISIGVASTSETDTTLDRTLTRADQALYRAKADGRNCVRVAEETAPSSAMPAG